MNVIAQFKEVAGREMTVLGPQRRLGDILQANIHRAFTNEADWFYESGLMNTDERILLSNLIGNALNVLSTGMPPELAMRDPDMPRISTIGGEIFYRETPQQPKGIVEKLLDGIGQLLHPQAKQEPVVPDVETANKSAFFKDASGQWWMIGIYSNRFKDREEEILSLEAHEEYAKWFAESGIVPAITTLHYPRMGKKFWETVWEKYQDDIPTLNQIIKAVYEDFSIGEAVKVTVINGFTAVVAKIYQDKAHIVEGLAELKDKIGMSHGFIVLQKTANIIDRYRSFEFSNLERTRAANVLTQPLFSEAAMSEKGLSDEDRKFFTAIGFDPTVLETGTQRAFERLAPIMEFKSLMTEEDTNHVSTEGEKDVTLLPDTQPVVPVPVAGTVTPPPPAEQPTQTPTPAPQGEPATPPAAAPVATQEPVVAPAEVVGAEYEAVRAQLMKDLDLPGLYEALKTLGTQVGTLTEEVKTLRGATEGIGEQVKAVQQTEDEKIAAQFTSPNWGSIGFSAAQNEKTVVGKDEKLALTKDAPVGSSPAGDPDNALASMLWNPLTRGPQNTHSSPLTPSAR
jgi:hypothetical protein